MSILQVFVLAVAAMIGLAALRVVRVHFGRTPLPQERGRRLFMLAFVVGPPLAVHALIDPSNGLLGGLGSIPLYLVFLAALMIAMAIAVLMVRTLAPGRSHRLIVLALIGSEGDSEAVPFDPALTPDLAENVRLVDKSNAVFPRGREFPLQIDRAGFRFAWDALDSATSALEAGIADEFRLGVAVGSRATATAADARNRLDTLHRLALDHGQVWAT
jgi:hypothetical protein